MVASAPSAAPSPGSCGVDSRGAVVNGSRQVEFQSGFGGYALTEELKSGLPGRRTRPFREGGAHRFFRRAPTGSFRPQRHWQKKKACRHAMNIVVAQVARAVAHMLKLSSRPESEVAGPEITNTL